MGSWSKDKADTEVAKYSPKDQAAVVAFFQNHGVPVSNPNSRGLRNIIARESSMYDAMLTSSIWGGGKPLFDVVPPPVTGTAVGYGCSGGWVAAMFTPDGSCGHVEVDGNAIVDPLAWEHIAGATLGGAVLIGIGGVMIYAGIGLCTGVLTCMAGACLLFLA